MINLDDWLLEQQQAISLSVEHPKSKPRALINAALNNIRLIQSISPFYGDALDQWVRKHYYVLRPVFRKRTEMGYVKDFNGFIKDTQHHLAQKVVDHLETHLDITDYEIINEYMKKTGDYLGLSVYPFYKVMASMNRAVAAMQANNEALFYYWIHVAYTVVQPKKLSVYIVSGLNADHRRALASTLCNQLGAIHLNTMDERLRLFGLTDASLIDASKVFSPEANQLTSHQISFLTDKILKSHYSVVLDGRFLKAANRQPFLEMAERFNARLIHCASIDPSLIYFDEDLKSDIDDYEVGVDAIEFEDFNAQTKHSILNQLL